MSQIQLTTFQDAYDHLADAFDVYPQDSSRPTRNIRRAILQAYRDLGRYHRWSYYDRKWVLYTSAPQTTGTIEYTHSTRTIDLTGATFPTDAKFYKITISDVSYEIESYTSSTAVVLGANSNPGADVASGTSYTLYQDTYDFPTNARRIRQAWDSDGNFQLYDKSSDHQTALAEVAYESPGDPWFYTIMRSQDNTSRMALVLTPPPDSATQFTILYEATPRDLRIQEYSSGTVTTSGTTCTLSNGTYPTDCVGSVIRFSENTDKPTGIAGNEDGLNPYYEERIITSRTSDTVVVLNEALTSDQTGVAYTVSDPIDVEPTAMLSAFHLMAEAEYCRLAGLDSDFAIRRPLADRAVRLAIESDRRAGLSRPVAAYNALRRSSITTDSG